MVLNLCSFIDKNEFEPFIASLIGSGELMKQAKEAGIPSRHLEFSNPVSLSGIIRLIRLIREWKIDIVQIHGLRADSIARWAVKLGGAKAVISTIHSIDPWRKWQHILVDKITAPFVDHYVAVCNAAAKVSIEREGLRSDNVTVVYIGVPDLIIPREQSDNIKEKLSITKNSPVVGILANLRDMKGHRYVIEALPELRHEFPDIVFLFAGRDDSNGEIREYAEKLGVSDSIRFLGFWKNPAELFAVMDMFLLPSDWEGLPVSIIEAMNAGVPVIASRVGGIPELIWDGEDGILIRPKSPEDIKKSITLLVRDWALRATIIKNADAKAQSTFHVKTMVNRMELIFKELL